MIWKCTCKEISVGPAEAENLCGWGGVSAHIWLCWDMDKAAKTVGAWNARRLACFTGKEIFLKGGIQNA